MWSIVHTEWSDGFGGQEQRILLECREMIRRGHRCLVVCRPEAALLPRARDAGIPVNAVPIRSSFDPVAVASLVRLFRRERTTVVNTHSGKDSWVAMMAAKMARVPLLIRTRHISVPVRRNVFNLVWRWPDGYVTTAEMIRAHLIAQGIAPERVVSIPTGVDVERFSPDVRGDRVRAEEGVPGGAFVLSMIGVLRSWKRHDVLVEAARLLRDRGFPLRVLVAGEGPRREAIAADIEDKGLAEFVRLMGFRRDVPEIIAASDAVALTSDRFEGVPQVLLQAMAGGKPVVASPIGGVPEVVRDGETGLLCPPGDAAAFADAVAKLAADPALRERLGAAGREHVLSRHTAAAMADRTEEFLSRLAAAKGIHSFLR